MTSTTTTSLYLISFANTQDMRVKRYRRDHGWCGVATLYTTDASNTSDLVAPGQLPRRLQAKAAMFAGLHVKFDVKSGKGCYVC